MNLTDLNTAKTVLNQAKSGNNWTPISGKFWTPIDKQLKSWGRVISRNASAIGENSTTGFNLGGIYDFNDDYHLLFSAGKGLSNISFTNKLTVYFALQVIY